MKPTANRRKAKNFIVNKKQLAIVIITTIYVFVILTAVMTLTIAPVYMEIFQSSDIYVQKQAAKSFILVSEKLGIALAAVFILLIIPLIVYTHRIFGPFVNFSNIFKRVSDGDLTARVNLRHNDLLKAEAANANVMFDTLAAVITELKEKNHQLVTALDNILEGQTHQQDMNGGIREACDHAHACETVLSGLQTGMMPDGEDKEGVH